MNTVSLTLFRKNIIEALRNSSNDEELKKELHNLLSKEIEKQAKPYLVRPVKVVNKTLH